MDDADITQERLEREQKARETRISASEPEVLATGLCLWCEEVLTPKKRWCDADCRDSWQQRYSSVKKTR